MSTMRLGLLLVLLSGCTSTAIGHWRGGEAGMAGSDEAAGSANAGSGATVSPGGQAGQTSTGGAGSQAGASTGGVAGQGAAGLAGSGGVGGAGDTCDLSAALAAALPSSFVWQSYSSSYFNGSANVCEKCANTPCGSCAIAWGTPAQSDPTTFLVPVSSSSCSVPALYGGCPATNADWINASVVSAVVTVVLQQQALGYTVISATVSGTWDLTAVYPEDITGSKALNASLSTALTGLEICAN